MGNTIRNVLPSMCAGCAACSNICPKKAISMEPGRDGFVFPVIDAQKCVGCGLCESTCPVIHPDYSNRKTPKEYGVWADDDIRAVSSSGGAFTLAAEWVLENGGIVCGCAFSDDFYSAEHIFVEAKEELQKLRGSKYLQSNIGDSYIRVREELEKGRIVLFTGTPCQVAAVKSFLKKPYDNLYLMDVVCHGVPSGAGFERFLRELEQKVGSKAVRVSFRDKTTGGWGHSTTIDFANGTHYAKKRKESSFMQAFLSRINLRESCGQCPFARLPRQGDISIADFWGVSNYDVTLNDMKGTGALLVNNEKGDALMEVIRKRSRRCEEVPGGTIAKGNGNVAHPSKLSASRDRFFDYLRRPGMTYDDIVDKVTMVKYDVGYVGWWYGANYGSVMTSFAMERVLRSMGKTVLMLDYPAQPGQSGVVYDSASRRLAKRFYEVSPRLELKDQAVFNKQCDAFLVGSDQQWNWWSNRSIGTDYYFLDFVDDKHRKIAYATSFGHDDGYYPEEKRLHISQLLNRFDAVSVREVSGIDICRHNFDVDAVQTMDPVFLCDRKNYEEVITGAAVKNNTPYVLGYILDITEEKVAAVRRCAEVFGVDYRIILDGQGNKEELKKQINGDKHFCIRVEIADWLSSFRNAEYVVTDSFHGFCFSIIFERLFAAFPNQKRGVTRFATISEYTGLTDRLVQSLDEIEKKDLWHKKIDYACVQKNLQPHIEWSRNWLKNAFEMPVRHDNSRALLIAQSETMKKQIAEQQERISKQDQEIQEQKQQLDEQRKWIEQLQRQTEELQRQTEALRRGFVTRVEKKLGNVIGRIKKA